MRRIMNKPFILLFSLLLVSSIQYLASADIEDDEGVVVETEYEDDTAQYKSPVVDEKNVYLSEHFDDLNAFKKNWVKSEAKKQGVDENIAKYDGVWEVQQPARRILKEDYGLVLTTEAKHAAISSLLKRPFVFNEKPFIVQYEVTMQEGQNCGGAYLKLLSKEKTSSAKDLKQFYDQTPYTIMFGPDKCGNDNKIHFIFRHKNPKNGTIEEKHSKKTSQRLDELFKDKEPHLYTLIINPDNTFVVKVDNKEVNSGSLLTDFTPPVNPPEEIDDPNDKKPEDWDEREKIIDPAASKPDDWDEDAPAEIVDESATKPSGWLEDEPQMLSDPEAKKPEDWDEEMDGEWEAPLIENPACASAPGCGPWSPPKIPNPAYKGIWRPPLIPNPNYRGKWTPKRIRNPDYFKDDQPFKMTSIYAVGFELWSMSPSLLFDNLIITDDPNIAVEYAEQTFVLKRTKLNKDADSMVSWLVTTTQENPWLWAVYIVVVFVFVCFFWYVCCTSSKEPESPDVDTKKTDAVTEDDPHAPSEDEGEGDAPQEEKQPEPKSSKQQLEEPVDDTKKEVSNEPDGSGDGQRKRKPRKE